MAQANNSADSVAEVTWERIRTIVEEDLQFTVNYDKNDPMCYAYVNGVPVRFDGKPLPLVAYINATLFEHTLPMARLHEAQDFVTNLNAKSHFVTGYVRPRAETDDVVFACDSSFVCAAGMSQEQLLDAVEHALMTVLRYTDEIAKHFEFEIPGLTAPLPEGQE